MSDRTYILKIHKKINITDETVCYHWFKEFAEGGSSYFRTRCITDAAVFEEVEAGEMLETIVTMYKEYPENGILICVEAINVENSTVRCSFTGNSKIVAEIAIEEISRFDLLDFD